jgi:RNA polymerase sigma factor (sigma-70 family)
MSAWRRILGVLRRCPEAGDPLPDGELLARFAASRDQGAFELLVWRHAAMVFGVCRRALKCEHDAEDAFQAVFLVLARKAGSVRGANVAGWLFRVARRVSAKAARRVPPSQELAVDPVAAALPDEVERGELRALLDAEIARLPERFRLPVLLCYLGGLSTEDAARQLRVPRGTILSRLSTARDRLAARLTRRGVTVPAVVLVPAATVTATVRNAAVFAARSPALSAVPASLAEGVLRTMTVNKLVPVAAACVLVAGLVSGVGVHPAKGVVPAAALQPEKATPMPPAPPPPNPRDDELKRLQHLLEKLQADIEAGERLLDDAIRIDGGNDRRSARLDRMLELLDTELFTTQREVAEHKIRRDLLRDKVAALNVPADAQLAAAIEQHRDVKAVAAEITNEEQKLVNLKAASGAESPAVMTQEKRVDVLKKSLVDVRGKVRDEIRQELGAVTRKELLARLAELDEKLIVTERLYRDRTVLRDDLLKQLTVSAGHNVNADRVTESLKPKKVFAARLTDRIAELEIERAKVPPAHAPVGTDAKLDKLLREVEELRKEVRDLKKR